MNQNVEIEFKNLLTEEEFLMLQEALTINKNQFIMQTNYYFDSPQFDLKNNRCALRIREKNNKYTMTLKQPNDVGLLETNLSLTKTEAENIMKNFDMVPEEMKVHLKDLQIPIDSITLLGALHTSRCEIQTKEALLVLDESTYGNKRDYEIEMEVTDEEKGKEFFLQFLEQYGIPLRKTDNKVRRFLNEVRN